MLSYNFLGVFVRRFTAAIYGQGTKNQILTDCVSLSIMHINEILTYHGVVVPVYATCGIYNLKAIIRKQSFGFIGRL